MLIRALTNWGSQKKGALAYAANIEQAHFSNLIGGKKGLTSTEKKKIAAALQPNIAKIMRVEKVDAEIVKNYEHSIEHLYSKLLEYCGDYTVHSPVLPWLRGKQKFFEIQERTLRLFQGKNRTYLFNLGRYEYDAGQIPIFVSGAALFASDRIFLIGCDAVNLRDLSLFILFRHSDSELFGLSTYSDYSHFGMRKTVLTRSHHPLADNLRTWLQNQPSGISINPSIGSCEGTRSKMRQRHRGRHKK